MNHISKRHFSNKKKEQPKEAELKNSEFYCEVCKSNMSSKGNLQAHYQSQKHKSCVIDEVIKNIPFYKKVETYSNNIKTLIDKYKKVQLIKSNYLDIIDSFKTQMDIIPASLTKTINDQNYLCTGCKNEFCELDKYKLHIKQCPQIEIKYNLLSQITISLIVQLKQLQEACTNGIQTDSKVTSKDKKIKDLEKQIKEFSIKTQNIMDSFDLKRNKLKEAKEKILILNNTVHTLNDNIKTIGFKNKILKEKCEKFKIQNNVLNNVSNNHTYNNNKTNFQIIFANNPPFEYKNPFINEETGMPTYPILPESKQALKDNENQPIEIQAKLCNAMMFSKSYKNKKLLDFVSTAMINLYVKKNSSEQSIWSTDTTRNTYNILLVDSTTKRKFWSKDKEGMTLKRILMQPIRQYLIDAIITYRHYCTQKHLGNKTEFEYPAPQEINDLHSNFMSSKQEVLNDLTDDEIIFLSKLFCGIDELQEYIRDPNFGKEVLKKMVNKFYFDKTKCLAQCISEEERTALLQDLSKIEEIEKDEKEQKNKQTIKQKLIEEKYDSEEFKEVNEPYYEDISEIIEKSDYYSEYSELESELELESEYKSEDSYTSSEDETKGKILKRENPYQSVTFPNSFHKRTSIECKKFNR